MSLKTTKILSIVLVLFCMSVWITGDPEVDAIVDAIVEAKVAEFEAKLEAKFAQVEAKFARVKAKLEANPDKDGVGVLGVCSKDQNSFGIHQLRDKSSLAFLILSFNLIAMMSLNLWTIVIAQRARKEIGNLHYNKNKPNDKPCINKIRRNKR